MMMRSAQVGLTLSNTEMLALREEELCSKISCR
jgi:hypothetical protein